MNNNTRNFLLSVLSGILAGISWPASGSPYFLFFAFVPLLILENNFKENPAGKKSVLWAYSYLTFFIWNCLVTWWVMNASVGGAAMAIICNSLLMSLIFLIFHLFTEKLPDLARYPVFIFFWISFEFLHLDWDLTWPWLTLGNAFGDSVYLIQWYEFTGVFGGTFWVLSSNVLLLLIIKKNGKKVKMEFISWALVLIVPVVISLLIPVRENNADKIDVVVVQQPNIDPYNEKFSGSFEQQLDMMVSLALPHVNDSTDYVVFPETALTEGGLYDHRLKDAVSVSRLAAWVESYQKLKVVTGATTFKMYQNFKDATFSSRKSALGYYYDVFNSAIQISPDGSVFLYHKSKLVPGVEKMPFPRLLRPLENLAINMGGTVGTLGIQRDRTVFKSENNSVVAPVICYESIFGEYVGQYLRNGANVIFVITNDGWWGDTPGYKQHLSFSRLRAIETRTWIARSANTGISCFINDRGDVLQPTQWWTKTAIRQEIPLQTRQTFYTRNGDYIARACLLLSGICFFAIPGYHLFRRKNRNFTLSKSMFYGKI